MNRLVAAIGLTLVLLACFGARTGAAYVYGYAGPGEWFSPGEGHGSVYDNACSRWVDNHFSKASGYWGLITFIDSGGNWSDGVQGYGYIRRYLTSVRWTKKLHCKNNSGATYQGGCFGNRNQYQCA